MKLLPAQHRGRHGKAWATRAIGLLLLVILLAQIDLGQLGNAFRKADLWLILVVIVGIVPLILIKTVRWLWILRGQDIHYARWPAFLAYFGSLFIGFLTPGRLGEFVKAVHVSLACDVSLARAFSSVLVDRLFDLYALIVVGIAALSTLAINTVEWIAIGGLVVCVTLPLAAFVYDLPLGRLQGLRRTAAHLVEKVPALASWLQEVQLGLRQLDARSLAATVGMTIMAYLIYFAQCYLLALALDISVGFGAVTYAVALGSLVTLLPISISGIGTRDAAIVAFLSFAGISREVALSFSLLVFLAFYVGGGLIGAVAWWMNPLPVGSVTSLESWRRLVQRMGG